MEPPVVAGGALCLYTCSGRCERLRRPLPQAVRILSDLCILRGAELPYSDFRETISMELLPRHVQLDHHPFIPFVVDQEVAMEQEATAFLEVCAGDRLASRTVGIDWCGPQDDVLAVKRAVALTNRHRGLSRVVPDGCEARLRIEAGDSGAGAVRAVRIEECDRTAETCRPAPCTACRSLL